MEDKEINKDIKKNYANVMSRRMCCESSECNMVNKNNNIDYSDEKLKDSGKLKVDVFVTLNACVCEWEQFMNRIFTILTPYIKYINYETKLLNSEEARRLNLHENCVIVDKNRKFTTSYTLKKELPKLLREKGLI